MRHVHLYFHWIPIVRPFPQTHQQLREMNPVLDMVSKYTHHNLATYRITHGWTCTAMVSLPCRICPTLPYMNRTTTHVIDYTNANVNYTHVQCQHGHKCLGSYPTRLVNWSGVLRVVMRCFIWLNRSVQTTLVTNFHIALSRTGGYHTHLVHMANGFPNPYDRGAPKALTLLERHAHHKTDIPPLR